VLLYYFLFLLINILFDDIIEFINNFYPDDFDPLLYRDDFVLDDFGTNLLLLLLLLFTVFIVLRLFNVLILLILLILLSLLILLILLSLL
jgi:hypothetical protein